MADFFSNFFGANPTAGQQPTFFDDPRQLGLMALATGLMQASGQQPMGVSRGGMIGQSIMGGAQQAQQAQRNQIMNQLAQAQLATAKAKAEREKNFPALMQQLANGGAPTASLPGMTAGAGTDTGGMGLEAPGSMGSMGGLMAGAPGVASGNLMQQGVPPELLKIWSAMGSDAGLKSYSDWQTAQMKAGMPNVPSGFQRGAGGALAPIPGGPNDLGYVAQKAEATTPFFFQKTYNPETGAEETIAIPRSQVGQSPQGPGGTRVVASKPVNPTDAQSNAALFATRMTESNETISGLESLGAEMTGTVTGSGYFPNALKSSDRQKMEQAQRNFVNAVLRRESGAVISPEEFDNAAKQYFPQPGDKPEVIAQKRTNRETAIEGIKRAAGPASPKSSPSRSSPPGVFPAPNQAGMLTPDFKLPPIEEITPQSLAKMTPAQRRTLSEQLKKMGF